jgi:hypothetical protein
MVPHYDQDLYHTSGMESLQFSAKAATHLPHLLVQLEGTKSESKGGVVLAEECDSSSERRACYT